MKEIHVVVPTQLPTLLRMARTARNKTQSEIARSLGLTTQALSKLEQNADKASFTRIHRLCLLLGLEIVLRSKTIPHHTGDTEAW